MFFFLGISIHWITSIHLFQSFNVLCFLQRIFLYFCFSAFYVILRYFFFAASKNKQRLGDMAAGTTVILVRPAVTLKDTILQTQQKPEYKIVFN